MENSCDLIKNAVRCFEQWSRTSVTIYTFQSAYWYLFAEYGMHPQKPCQTIKKKHLQKCMTFDNKQLRDEILILRAGYLKICPGGFLEWCFPIHVDHTVIGIVLAGLRTPPAVLPAEYPVIDSRYRVPETKIHAVPQTDDAEIHLVMEGLKQLGARIEQILASENIIHDTVDTPRATQIRLIIQKNLAEDLYPFHAQRISPFECEPDIPSDPGVDRMHISAAVDPLPYGICRISAETQRVRYDRGRNPVRISLRHAFSCRIQKVLRHDTFGIQTQSYCQ